jgi:hydroxymethylpyrimidine/phosphomethylpyrimidine kinase
LKVLLCIAGLDSSGGAGLATDARVARAHGYHPALVCTAVTAQGERGVQRIEPVPADGVRAQIEEALYGHRGVLAGVKVGMLGLPATAVVVVESLAALVAGAAPAGTAGTAGQDPYPEVPLVWDPVFAASAGGALLQADPGHGTSTAADLHLHGGVAIDDLHPHAGVAAADLHGGVAAELALLLRRADVVTPNLTEAGLLAGALAPADADLEVGEAAPVWDLASMRAAARSLRRAGARAVLVTGGHLPGEPVDVLVNGSPGDPEIREYSDVRIASGNPGGEAPGAATAPDARGGGAAPAPDVRGTGCALSTALACNLAAGAPLPDAVAAARRDLRRRLERAYSLGGRHRYLP